MATRYLAAGYYGPGGRKGGKNRPGEREGQLAFKVESASESARDADAAAMRRREDIGRVITWEVDDG